MPVASTDERLQRLKRERNLPGWAPVRLLAQDGPCGECRGEGWTIYLPDYFKPGMGYEPPRERCTACAGTGLRLRPWAELAAYAGAEWAREALGLRDRCPDGHDWSKDGDGCQVVSDGRSPPAPVHAPGLFCAYRTLPEFARGLSRWGPQVKARAWDAVHSRPWPETLARRSAIQTALVAYALQRLGWDA